MKMCQNMSKHVNFYLVWLNVLQTIQMIVFCAISDAFFIIFKSKLDYLIQNFYNGTHK